MFFDIVENDYFLFIFNMNKKVYLIILDGFGLGAHDKGDALFHGKTPYIDSLLEEYSFARLKTHGSAVGLPEFQTGGSEPGHITIGAGRAVKHLLTKINDQIESGEFFTNVKLIQLMEKAKKQNKIHLIGMISDGGIHSFQPHLYGLLKMAQQYKIENIYIHPISDGRDVGDRTVKEYIHQLQTQKIGKLATLGGRFYAMDRDNNDERTAEYTQAIFGNSIKPIDIEDYIDEFYENTTESDYYIPPVTLLKEGRIQKDDVVINFNYRTDRMRQLSERIAEKIGKENYGIFGPYCEGAIEPFHFGDIKIKNTLGQVIADKGGMQLRISETEKFNHVTFYFSGQTKEKFKNEHRILIHSPKCKTYAEKPEMSAREQTDALKKELAHSEYNVIVQNYANADLVGHSGNLKAAEHAAEVLDNCLKEIIPFAQKKGYEIFVTADHGNAEVMLNPDGSVNSSHTQSFVPFVWVAENKKLIKEKGTLQDIAPTILNVLHVDIPQEMTGESVWEV